MAFHNKKIGFGVTGSHCTLEEIIPVMDALIERNAELFPIVSPSVENLDTRFGKAEDWITAIENVCKKKVKRNIAEVEPFGPNKLLDIMVIAPCTGNTMAKLSRGIIDTSVLMAAKSQLRNQNPVVLSVSTNDGLGINARSLAIMLNTKNVYLVPFHQDKPYEKPNSLVARIDLIIPTIEAALNNYQLQPILSIS